MNNFRMTHPQDLITRLFIFEYLRELGAQKVYDASNEFVRNKTFYKFTVEEEDKEHVDFNWEYLIFIATIHELDKLLQPLEKEVMEIVEKKKKTTKEYVKKIEESKKVDSISLYDLAAAKMKKDKNGII